MKQRLEIFSFEDEFFAEPEDENITGVLTIERCCGMLCKDRMDKTQLSSLCFIMMTVL
jgi:hypothetical protein